MDLFGDSIIGRAEELFKELETQDDAACVETINAIRLALHRYSPFSKEPVDCVVWIPAEKVSANDYNPNTVAPPEMRLLELSIEADGYTQPIVTWDRIDGTYEVVDGFHRNRVGQESKAVRARIKGYLPLTVINPDRQDRNDRIAATIRHNRARGKHQVQAMSDIVIELKRRNWTDEKIGNELGMDPDEVLRLCQITGLAEVFANTEFSQAWDIDTGNDTDQELFSDEEQLAEQKESKRVYHTWEKWECYRAGFYEERPPDGMTQDQGEEIYREFLADLAQFGAALEIVIQTWKHSCEHYLTNDRMNRIAWLGQASVAQARGIPSCCRGGYHRLTEEQKQAADMLALEYLNKWLVARGERMLTFAEAQSRTEADLY